MYWQFYAQSQYFRETNYEPELFLQGPINRCSGWQIGLNHQSNGRGGMLEVHIVFGLAERRHWLIMIGDSQARADRYAQRLGEMRLLRIDAREHVDVQVVDLQRQKIVKSSVHSSPHAAREAAVRRGLFSLSFCEAGAKAPASGAAPCAIDGGSARRVSHCSPGQPA